ncbi:putative undecaprenyl diphosphate synthase-domain-containing protein [Ilyonectria sp. MPI-CAGE-AT-0026]|nr:putative undecaprenyl diphosphate synthase-domain-containing protein [Ilyonectria sp. MPI-CAGE-AT-0026]
MSMADKLDPNDLGRKVPMTMAEVQQYLRKELQFDGLQTPKIQHEYLFLCNLLEKKGALGDGGLLRRPFTFAALFVFRRFVWALSGSVIGDESCSRGVVGMSFWWCLRKASCFFSYFHYSICPRTLTLDGTLDLLVSGDSRMADVSTDLYQEIFGSNDDSLSQGLHNKSLRRFPDIEAHVPIIMNAKRPIYPVSRFCEEFTEVLKCSYYRGKVLHNIDQLPQHLGVIMDGNRRYSRHRGLGSVLDGHQVGAYKLLQVLSWAFSSGVRNLTVWALSDDNLKRGSQELNPLFSMMAEYIEEIVAGDSAFLVPEIRFRVIGNKSILPDHLNHMIDKAEAATSQNTKFNLQMAIGYGGRSEITRAARLAVKAKVSQEGLSVEEAVQNITEADISRQTYSAQLGLPQIDTILRTSGENRLSGFALWESHHAEFEVVEENWPELKQSTFLRSLLDLSKRNRRLGV